MVFQIPRDHSHLLYLPTYVCKISTYTNFRRVVMATKIKPRENLTSEKFYQRKFPNLREAQPHPPHRAAKCITSARSWPKLHCNFLHASKQGAIKHAHAVANSWLPGTHNLWHYRFFFSSTVSPLRLQETLKHWACTCTFVAFHSFIHSFITIFFFALGV